MLCNPLNVIPFISFTNDLTQKKDPPLDSLGEFIEEAGVINQLD